MAKLMASYLKKYPVPGEVLVPVPLHQARLRERGYNQSELIAGELSRLTGLEVSEGCLIRRRNTPSQARTANVTERRKNIAGAFESRGNSLAGKKVILIDDVATSEAAKIRQRIEGVLAERFHIDHSAIQMECDECNPSDVFCKLNVCQPGKEHEAHDHK